VVARDAVLAAGIAAALGALGWLATALSGCAGPAGAADGIGHVPLVLVVDGLGPIPDLLRAVGDALRGDRLVIAVGSLAALTGLERVVSRAGAAALCLEQPLPDLVWEIHRALSAPVRQWGVDGVVTDLREREQEARRFAMLTPREQDVLGALVTGKSAVEIAESDCASVATVRSQIRGILTKLGVSSQLAAVALTHRSCREHRVVAHIRRLHRYG